MNISVFMKKIGCTKWPDRWENFYDSLTEDFEKNGCALTNPDYYDEIHEKYGVLNEYLDVFKAAAVEVGKNRDLSLLLALLCKAMQDREHIMEDIASLSLPEAPEGANPIAYTMLSGLAMCSMAGYCYEKLAKRNLPPEIMKNSLNKPEFAVQRYMKRHNGEPGYMLFDWFQLAVDARLYNINRLEIETECTFFFPAVIFRNEAGECVTLADKVTLHRSGHVLGTKYFEDADGSWEAVITETDAYWEGYPYGEDALVSATPVRLEKALWKKALEPKDPVVNLHIPASGKLTPELVDETLQDVQDFLATYFPDFRYKAFICSSWLLDPQHEDLLGAESNIVRFGKRFRRITLQDTGKAVFNFVYGNTNAEIETLPEDTHLHRALKKHFLSGKTIYSVGGYFF